jgi:hypothetical protein
VVQDLLELGCGLRTLTQAQVRQAAQVHRLGVSARKAIRMPAVHHLGGLAAPGSLLMSIAKHAFGFSLPQLPVLCFGLLQDRNIRVSVLPQREEILIGRLGLAEVALQHISATEAKMG